MSRKTRRALALASVIAALFLTFPAPSQAAGFWSLPPADLAVRMWSWIESLGLFQGPAPQPRPTRWEKEGSMVDPNGQPGIHLTAPSATSNTDEGSMVDPDGRP